MHGCSPPPSLPWPVMSPSAPLPPVLVHFALMQFQFLEAEPYGPPREALMPQPMPQARQSFRSRGSDPGKGATAFSVLPQPGIAPGRLEKF